MSDSNLSIGPFGFVRNQSLTVGPFGFLEFVSDGTQDSGSPPNVFFGSTQMSQIFVGSEQVNKVYFGSTLIYDNQAATSS